MDGSRITELTVAIRMTCTNPDNSGRPDRPSLIVSFDGSEEALAFSKGKSRLRQLAESLDMRDIPTFPRRVTSHQVAETLADVIRSTRAYPNAVVVEGCGLFTLGRTLREAVRTRGFLLEKKRFQIGTSLEEIAGLRLAGCVALVTGGAQGFGRGIVDELAREGAHVVIADIREDPGRRACAEVCETFGDQIAEYTQCDVTNLASIDGALAQAVRTFGGVDLFVSNAGVLKAGSLEEMDEKAFRLVTDVNYTAFYLCTKAASRYMKLQHAFNPHHYSDIVQINSKSGLCGSNRNFAYAGSKFGSIGLVQSFALELVPHRIKVNAICPGNYFEGPLWSDPENGLFVQYLRAGKVPGARTVEDVRESYVSKVPMRRGCSPLDVSRAILYVCEQEYETGQAVPVTGGQAMLR